MRSNLVVRAIDRERITDGRIPDPFLSDVVQHGDARTLGTVLGLGAPRMTAMLQGEKRSPFAAARIVVEQLRRNGNPRADEPFIRLGRDLGFIVYRSNVTAATDIELSDALKEVSDVLRVRAERASDGVWDAADCRATAKEVDEAIERFAALRDRLISDAVALESKPARRIV